MSSEVIPEVSGDDSALVPPQSAPRSQWPKKLRSLSAGDLDRLTIDAEGRFYWDGRLVNYEGQQPKADNSHSDRRAPEPRAQDSHAPELRATDARAPEGRAPEVKALGAKSDSMDLSALEILDRAAIELSRPPEARTTDPSMVPMPASDEPAPRAAMPEDSRPAAPAIPTPPAAPVRSVAPAVIPTVRAAEPLRAAEPRRAAEPFRADDAAQRDRREKVRVRLSLLQSIALAVMTLALLLAAIGIASIGWVAMQDWACRTGTQTSGCPLPPATQAPPARLDIPS